MSIFSLVVSILSFQFFFYSTFLVEGPSMAPTFESGEVILVQKIWNQETPYERGDIVVFTLPDAPDYFYVKRIVGLPGEAIQIRSDGIYFNRAESSTQPLRLSEPYLAAGVSSVPRTSLYKDDYRKSYIVPNGNYFVLGDNREQSQDSRHFRNPFIEHSQIRGHHILDIYSGQEDTSWSTIVVETLDGPVPFAVEVAETMDKRRQGLMHRERLMNGHGMYFIFEDEANRSFWMKNTLIPLDMVFVDEDGRIVHIASQAMPCKEDPCPNYPSKFPAQYVLEIGGGQAKALDIRVGDTVTFIR